jgi:hypothetical protein
MTGAQVSKRDLWDAWAFAAAESSIRLNAWMSAPPAEKELRYGSYVASLDREQQAATVLASVADRPQGRRLRLGL